jgi:hypothetical protein
MRQIGKDDGVNSVNGFNGFSGLMLPLWHRLFFNAGRPASAAAACDRALPDTLAQLAVKARLAASAITVVPTGGQGLQAFASWLAALQAGTVKSPRITMA